MFKLLYRYCASKFWPPFFFGLGVFALLVFLGDLFDHINYIMRTEASIGTVLHYFALAIPFWTLTVVPVAVLLAALFALSEMIASGEWMAALASGFHPRQIYLPVVACAVLVAAANFTLQETVSPRLHFTADKIFERDIKGKKNFDKPIRNNIIVKIGKNAFISAQRLDLASGEMDRPMLSVIGGGKAVSQTDARSAKWDPVSEKWIFVKGLRREMPRKGPPTETAFDTWTSTVDVPPSDMLSEKIYPEDLTIRDILQRLPLLRKMGSPTHRELTYLHCKLAAPFNWTIICLLGIPFAVVVRKANKMLHFAAALVITFFFWWVISIAQSAGEAGLVPPLVAGWTPVLVFGALAALGIRTARI